MYRYKLEGSFGFIEELLKPTMVVGVGHDYDDSDPRVLTPEESTPEKAQELLGQSQYLGTGLCATLLEIL